MWLAQYPRNRALYREKVGLVLHERVNNMRVWRVAVFLNGLVCKDPKLATADDFFFAGLNIPGNTMNPLGSAVTPVFTPQLPGLNTLGTGLARLDLAPGGGLVPPHYHPRATEILVVLQGQILVGFVSSDNRLFIKLLRVGDVFVFPKALIHFQFNSGRAPATAIVSFNSQNPGVVLLANALFGTAPKIPDFILAKAFQIDKKVVDYLQTKF